MTESMMTSVFMSGRSQAVRIPKAFRLDAEQVRIRKRGESLVLTPIEKEDPWASMKEVVGTFPKDCFDFRDGDWPEREYPRMGFDESAEHFEARVRDYERWRDEYERKWKARHGEGNLGRTKGADYAE